jgi:hypothetical protein
MSFRPSQRNPFFPLTVAFSGLFIVTILALIAAVFSEGDAPLSRLLDRHGGWILAAEVLGILLAGFLALAVDRAQNATARSDPPAPRPHVEESHEQTHPGGN